jgi:ABC-type sugar transport system ATPase subunit
MTATATATPMVRAEHIVKRFGSNTVLKDISLEVGAARCSA